MNYKNMTRPLKFTAIGMLVLVAVFYPVFEYLEKQIEQITKTLIKRGKNAFGTKLGFILVFSAILLALFSIYANLWFDINVPRMLWNRVR